MESRTGDDHNSNSTSYSIQRTNFADIQQYATIGNCGRRGSGKTFVTRDILHALKGRVGRFMVLYKISNNVREYRPEISRLYFHKLSIERLKAIRDKQKKLCEYYGEKNLDIPRKLRLCLILEDCGSDSKFIRHPIVVDLLHNGRHYGMYIIIK